MKKKKERKEENWIEELYRLAILEFSIDLKILTEMRKEYEFAIQEYKKTGKITPEKKQTDEIAIAKAKSLITAFEKLSEKEQHREEFNRDFKFICDNFTSITPSGAIVGE